MPDPRDEQVAAEPSTTLNASAVSTQDGGERMNGEAAGTGPLPAHSPGDEGLRANVCLHGLHEQCDGIQDTATSTDCSCPCHLPAPAATEAGEGA